MEPRAASCSSVREDSCFGSEWIVFGLDCVWGDVVAESVVFGYRFELKKGVPLTNLNVDNKQEITHHGKDNTNTNARTHQQGIRQRIHQHPIRTAHASHAAQKILSHRHVRKRQIHQNDDEQMTSGIVAQHPSQRFESSVRQGDGSFVLRRDGDVVQHQQGEVLFRRVPATSSQKGKEGRYQRRDAGVVVVIVATSLPAASVSHHGDPLSSARGVFRKGEEGSERPRRDVRRGVGRNDRGEGGDVAGQAVEGGRGVEGGLNAEEVRKVGGVDDGRGWVRRGRRVFFGTSVGIRGDEGGASRALFPKRRQRRIQTLEIAVHRFRFVSAVVVGSEEMAVVVVVVVAVGGRGYRFGNVSQIVLLEVVVVVVVVVVSHVDDPSFRREAGIAATRICMEIVAATLPARRRGLHHLQRIAVDRSVDDDVRVGGIPGTG
mmetsp:Transcript_30222/g.62341  ORF Transcript_30222/g.62341 Transcript_30222/m.62341 type:complete len:432 (-) Transcript_30222:71-1366(-)